MTRMCPDVLPAEDLGSPQHETWAVFVLSSVLQGSREGQGEAKAGNLISICLNEMEEADPVFE